MAKEKSSLYILNLVGDLSESLTKYFEKISAEVIERGECENYEELTHILVATGDEAKNASTDYNTDENEISIICLGDIREMKDFLLHSGRLAIDPVFAESDFGEYILNKYFTKNYNIHLDESFSSLFPETHEFKITNHLNTGLYFDEVSVKAFKEGFNLVSLRSFMDHITYYITYLKQAGLAGVPFEVEYANNDDFFVLNIHAPVRNFVAEYMIDSFGSVNSKDPLSYLLGVSSRSSDFLDITYLENPGRIIFTAAWSKGEQKKLNGLAFNNIKTTAQSLAQIEKKIEQYTGEEDNQQQLEISQEEMQSQNLPGGILKMILNLDEDSSLNKDPEKMSSFIAFTVATYEEKFPDKPLGDIGMPELEGIMGDYPNQDFITQLTAEDKNHILERLQKKNISDAYDEELQRVRATIEDKDDYKKVLQESLSEQVAKKVSGHFDADVLNRILGSKEEKEKAIKVKGQKDADDFKTVVKAMDKKSDGDFMTIVSGAFEKKGMEFNNKIGTGTPEENKKNISMFLNSAVDEIEKSSGMDRSIKRFVKDKAPRALEIAMERYAESMGQTLESLSNIQVMEFKEIELSKVMEEVLSSEQDIEEFSKDLEQGIEGRGASVFANISPEFEDKLKVNLVKKLDKLENVEKQDDKFVVSDNQVSEEEMQLVIKESIQETLDEEFVLEKANNKEIEKKEVQIIKTLTATLNLEEKEVSQIVKGASQVVKEKEVQTVVDNVFKSQPGEIQEEAPQVTKTDFSKDKSVESDSEAGSASSSVAEATLIAKLKATEEENKTLSRSIAALTVKLKAEEITKSQTESLIQEAKKEPEKEIQKAETESKPGDVDPTSLKDKKDLMNNIKSGEALSPEQAKAMEHALEKEASLIAVAKNAEINIKKLQLELDKRETLFRAELERANKVVQGKELVIDKVKSNVKMLITKKEEEIRNQKLKVEDLNKRLENDQSTRLLQNIKVLTTDNMGLAKTAELYKNKLSNLSKSMMDKRKGDNSKQLADQKRIVEREVIQLENKLNIELKQKKSLEDRLNKAKDVEKTLRSSFSTGEEKSKQLEAEVRTLKEAQAKNDKDSTSSEASTKNDSAEEAKLIAQVGNLNEQNTKLQAKLIDAAEKIKAAASSGGNASSKEKHLEKNNKMLQAEISKNKGEMATSKKDVIKMKSENTAMKNQLTKLKKDLEKAQTGKGGKKAA